MCDGEAKVRVDDCLCREGGGRGPLHPEDEDVEDVDVDGLEKLAEDDQGGEAGDGDEADQEEKHDEAVDVAAVGPGGVAREGREGGQGAEELLVMGHAAGRHRLIKRQQQRQRRKNFFLLLKSSIFQYTHQNGDVGDCRYLRHHRRPDHHVEVGLLQVSVLEGPHEGVGALAPGDVGRHRRDHGPHEDEGDEEEAGDLRRPRLREAALGVNGDGEEPQAGEGVEGGGGRGERVAVVHGGGETLDTSYFFATKLLET